MQTEFSFTLPLGFVDSRGQTHRQGVMRLATALDEVAALEDPRVRQNDAYLGLILLGRVVRDLGTLSKVGPETIGSLFSADYQYLQAFYLDINTGSKASLNPSSVAVTLRDALESISLLETACPTCGTRFALDAAALVQESVREFTGEGAL